MSRVHAVVPIHIILFILLVFLFTSSSTQYEVTGVLVDPNQVPVAGLSVMLFNESDEQIASDQTDSQGRFSLVYQVEPTSADPVGGVDMPSEFKLGSSYPNPFNPRTTVPFYAPENTNAIITVYNVLGQQVLHTQANLSAGSHEIHVNLGGRLSQGQYILQIQGNGFSLTRSMTFLSAGIGGGNPEIRVRQGAQPSSRVVSSMQQADEEMKYRIVVEETDQYLGFEIQVPAYQDYEVDIVQLARKMQPPKLSTQQAVNVTLTTARSGGTILDDGGSEITEMGVVWATSVNPTVTTHDGMTADTLGNGAFYSRITGLSPEKTYFVRAYATNSAGTSYGESFEFHTPKVEETKEAIDETVTRVLSENFLPIAAEEFENVPEEQQAEYLDSLDAALNRLTNVLNEYYSEEEFKEGFQSYFEPMSKIINDGLEEQGSLSCHDNLRIALVKGLSVDLSASASISSGLSEKISLFNGAGVETIYDLVNLDRSVYHFQMCGYDTDALLELDVGATLALDLKGFYRFFTNVPTNDPGNVNRFTGTVKGRKLNVRGSLFAKLGLEFSFSLGSAEQTSPFTFNNFSKCPAEIPGAITNHRGISEYSFDIGKSLGIGKEISAVIETEEFATSRSPVEYFYKDYGDRYQWRILAATNMATDMILPSIDEGLLSIIDPTDLGFGFLTMAYVSLFDPNSCPPSQYMPDVRTLEASSLTHNTATISAIIVDDGDAAITERGICWSETNNSDSFTNCTNEGTGIGEFSSTISELQSDTRYYARAFAGNSVGRAYGDRISFTTLEEVVDPGHGTPGNGVTDIDGNFYRTVIIGDQEWMAENLRVTRYRDGSLINTGLSDTDWENTKSGAYAIYPHTGGSIEGNVVGINSDEEMVNAYGIIYNWYAVDNSRGLCPEGWRVPKDAEWQQLVDHLMDAYGFHNNPLSDDIDGVGNKLRSRRQINSPLGEPWTTDTHPRWAYIHGTHFGTDDFGFSGLPGGVRDSDGSFGGIGYVVYWWSSNILVQEWSILWGLMASHGNLNRGASPLSSGSSVRCIRDD